MTLSRWAISALFILFLAVPALALDLQAARTGGLVGEQRDGYVAALKSTPDVQALAAEVNARRREEYQRISGENGQPVDIVAKLAAQQIVGKLAPGSLYQGEDGGWKKK